MPLGAGFTEVQWFYQTANHKTCPHRNVEIVFIVYPSSLPVHFQASRYEIYTPRLCLRPLDRSNSAALHAIVVHPQVRRFLCDDQIVSDQQIADWVEESLILFQQHGFGLWGLFFATDLQRLIGFCGFWYFHTPPELELTYGLAFDCWRQGLATEAVRSMLHYGFHTLKFDRIAASTDVPNIASQRVLDKLGMIPVRRSQIAGAELIHYSIDSAEFMNSYDHSYCNTD
jgi:ribosomal-protein-alanine N-acetyltransferase